MADRPNRSPDRLLGQAGRSEPFRERRHAHILDFARGGVYVPHYRIERSEMGKKANIAKASLATAFLAAGGVSATQASAEDSPSVEGVVSSYFGPLGLRDDFQQYVKLNSGFDSFFKFWKVQQDEANRFVAKFSQL